MSSVGMRRAVTWLVIYIKARVLDFRFNRTTWSSRIYFTKNKYINFLHISIDDVIMYKNWPNNYTWVLFQQYSKCSNHGEIVIRIIYGKLFWYKIVIIVRILVYEMYILVEIYFAIRHTKMRNMDKKNILYVRIY